MNIESQRRTHQEGGAELTGGQGAIVRLESVVEGGLVDSLQLRRRTGQKAQHGGTFVSHLFRS